MGLRSMTVKKMSAIADGHVLGHRRRYGTSLVSLFSKDLSHFGQDITGRDTLSGLYLLHRCPERIHSLRPFGKLDEPLIRG
jgi:hypothetical protein